MKIYPNLFPNTATVNQLIVILSNSKYTYSHFQEFHETVLDLLGNNDLFNLSPEQLKNNQFFINIVLKLLDEPTKSTVALNKRSGYQKSPSQHQSLLKEEAGQIGNAVQLTLPPVFKQDFQKLLNWISQVVLLKRITIEQMLDEFYSLGISGLKNSARLN